MAKTKAKKEVANLETLPEAEVIEIFKKVCKKPLLDHKLPELIRQIRVVYAAKKIKEAQIMALQKFTKASAPKTVKENYQFKRRFKPQEITEKADQLANACVQVNTISDEFKSVKSGYKSKIEAEEAKINLIAGDLQRGFEDVMRTCEVLYDYAKGMKFYYYEKEEVGQERMVAADYQLKASL